MKDFSRYFYTRSESNTAEIRAYIYGLLQAKHRAANMERMEEEVENFNYQAVHNCITHSPWESRPVMDEVAQRANGLLGGGPRTRLIFDDTGVLKKGNYSVGVARQYIGRIGKIENGQIAVCASLASGQRSTLIDIRLYLPESWTSAPQRCEKAGIPEEHRAFKTKTALALESARHQRAQGINFDVVSMDSGYGSDTNFLHALDQDGETFVAEIHHNQTLWEQAPWPHHQPKRGKKPLQKPRPSHPGKQASQIISQTPEDEWKRLKIRDSDQGWVEVNYHAQRIWVIENDLQKPWWLLTWENPDERSNNGQSPKAPRKHYALSNAPADQDPRELIRDGVQRNSVERDFRDAKSEVGMADYQTRGWVAWHHHMSLVMLTMLFLTQEKMHSPPIHSEEGPVNITSGDLAFVLEKLLPRRGYGTCETKEVEEMTSKRINQRIKDQVNRRKATKSNRPPFSPDEDLIQVT